MSTRRQSDFDLEEYNRELRWELAGGPYGAAMAKLSSLIIDWIEHPGSVKGDLISAWRDLHPKERKALDAELRSVWSKLYGGTAILYRKRDDRTSGDWGGSSMTDRLEKEELNYYLVDPHRSKFIDEWDVRDELRAFHVGVDDVMLHWGMKDCPLGQGRWAWEHEIVLAPGAKVRELSRGELLEHLKGVAVKRASGTRTAAHVTTDRSEALRLVKPAVSFRIYKGKLLMDIAKSEDEARDKLDRYDGARIEKETQSPEHALEKITSYVVGRREGRDVESYFAGRGRWTERVDDAKRYDTAHEARQSAEYHARQQSGAFPVVPLYVFDEGRRSSRKATAMSERELTNHLNAYGTWFNLNEYEDDRVLIDTRRHGSVAAEEPGRKDIQEGKRVLGLLKDDWSSWRWKLEVVDEWVIIEGILDAPGEIGHMSKDELFSVIKRRYPDAQKVRTYGFEVMVDGESVSMSHVTYGGAGWAVQLPWGQVQVARDEQTLFKLIEKSIRMSKKGQTLQRTASGIPEMWENRL